MPRQSWFQKIGNAFKKMASGLPLGRQTSVPSTPRAAKAAARGHRAGEYHFGRVTAIKDENGKTISHRVGPVPDPSGETYRGARAATLDHVLTMLRRQKEVEDVTLCVYGRMYPENPEDRGSKRFTWICAVFNRDEVMTNLENEKEVGATQEEAVYNIFGLENYPSLILAWEVKPHA